MAVGIVLGLGLAAILSRGLTSLLVDVAPWDPLIFVIVVVLLASAGVAACVIPARRAIRVDPVQALRYD